VFSGVRLKDAERPIAEGVDGFYVCGSTGEGVSLTTNERKRVAEAFIDAAAGRLPVVVQVGHNSLEEARELAAHAEAAGAAATSAMPMVAFLEQAAPRIPNLAGLKYTAHTLHEYQACVALDGGRHDVLYGFDELLLPALAVGARGAVGSTFNIAAPLYRRLIDAFEAGDLGAAREAQLFAVEMITAIARHPFHPEMKLILEWLGTPCGGCRLPLPRLDEAAAEELRSQLETLGFFVQARPQPATA
jgi:N-acetylneuraminate lyase